MHKSIAEQIEQLQQAITAQEMLRPSLGDDVVEATIAALRQHLAILQAEPATEQRKQVTILFADLVGFTAMAEHMDPEDVRDIMNAYFGRLTPAITRFGGVIEKYIGDAVMAVFGVPTASESDPENAIRAALAMHEALDELKGVLQKQQGIRLAMRIGINTGPVVVSSLTGNLEEDLAVVGDTVNVASRLEQAAEPNTILISHNTYSQVRGVFTVQALEPLLMKGKTESISVYQIVDAKPRAFRLSSRGVWGVETRMIGRRKELAYLQEGLQGVAEKQQLHSVLIYGDAGLGKSRLLYEFRSWLQITPDYQVMIFNGRASQEMRAMPYALIRDILAFRFEIQDSDPPVIARQKLETGIVGLMGESGRDKAPFLGRLIGMDFSSSSQLQGILSDTQQIRDRAFHYAAQLIAAAARQNPIAIYLEDLHWADDDSLNLIEYLIRESHDLPVLVVCLTRPPLFERRPHWQDEPGSGHQLFTTQLSMNPLSSVESRRLIDEILRKASHVPPKLSQLIVGRAGGNPFFIEELIKMLVEDGVIIAEGEQWQVRLDRFSETRVPPTLTGILQARLDSLPLLERETLQRASVVGRVFWLDILAHLGSTSRMTIPSLREQEISVANELERVLEELQRKELVFKRDSSGFAGTPEYIFKNTILHNVVYESVLKRKRRVYHAYVAEWLIEHSGQRVDEHAGLIGKHFELARNIIKAARWYGRAGKQAQETYAPEAAITYFQKALSLMPDDLTDRPDYIELYAEQKITYCEGLGQELWRRARYAESTAAFKAMLQTAEAAGDLLAQARAWDELAAVYDGYGDYRESLDNAERAKETAEMAGEPGQAILVRALISKGWALHRLGDSAAALALGEHSLALSTRLNSPQRMASSLNLLGVAHEMLGRYDESIKYTSQALELYRQLGDKRGEAVLTNNLGETERTRGNYREAVNLYQNALNIAREIGSRELELMCLVNRSGAQVGFGDYKSAEIGLSQVMEMAESVSPGWLSEIYRFLAEAYLGQERIEEALAAAKQALILGRDQEEPLHIGTAWRVLGEIAAQLKRPVNISIGPGGAYHNSRAVLEYDAAACFAESWHVFSEIQMEAAEAQTLLAWARYQLEQGDHKGGAEMWQDARDIFVRLDLELEVKRMDIERPDLANKERG